MTLIKSKRGFLFTIATIILIIPLIYLVSFYSSVSETQMEDTISTIRCDELHYYVEDVRRDMERAVTIFGRRAAAYAIDEIINTPPSTFLSNYTFNCTKYCHVNCTTFIHPENGSEAAIAELIVCGTLHGKNVTKMLNNTLPEWIEGITEEGRLMGFDVNITPFKIKVVPIDAWHFATIVENKVRVSDKEGLCFYTESIMTAISNSSIIGLEDPLYTVRILEKGGENKQIWPCDNPVLPRAKAGCGVNGSGISGGRAVFSTDMGNMNEYREYCNGSSSTVPPTGDVQRQVFVLNEDKASLCTPGMKECFNANMPRHFRAFIAYKNLPANCNVTIPYITGTGDLENDPPVFGGSVDPECNDTRIKSGDCLLVLNINESCPGLHSLHYVLLGYNSTDVNISCYYVSDVENYATTCSINLSNGPCFFDRLDGNLNLSKKYVEQANETFGTTSIGIESFVDIYMLYNMKNLGYDVVVNSTYSWIDYLYWQNITGCDVSGYCEATNYSFKLDCSHAHKYRLDTICENVSKCPVCGDGFCDSLEDCVSCPADCECPGCPVFINLTNCKENCNGNCDVVFNLSVMNQTGHLMNLSANPVINITIKKGGVTSSSMETMDISETGKYYYIEKNVNKNWWINGSVRIKEPGCPLLRNATEFMQVNNPLFHDCH